MRWVALVALALLPLAGCMAPADCPSAAAPRLVAPQVGSDFTATDGRQPWDTLVLQDAPADEAMAANVSAMPYEWPAWVTPMGNATAGPILLRVRAQPGSSTSANVTLAWAATVEQQGCRSGQSGHLRWTLAAPEAGAVARAGAGVRVLTAGFLEDGTLFYTNIETVNNDTRWTHAPIYSWAGAAPLPVYVYDHDRAERSTAWSATTGGSPLGPATGNMTAWNYYTTIPGFNDALKGLSTNTVRVVRLAPEQAYTDANHTTHPLYGLPLIFLIKLVAVEELPCTDLGPVCVAAMDQNHALENLGLHTS